MSKYRNNLPQLNGGLFLTDGGIETTLIFHDGFDLPHFAAFDLLNDPKGMAALKKYFATYAGIARTNGVGFVLESPTWRASSDWAEKLSYSPEDLEAVNRDAIDLMKAVRTEFETGDSPMVVSGCVGPRGDGYDPGHVMSPEEAETYHGGQIRSFGKAGADMITAITMTNVNEAVGLTRAAKAADIPVVISFTVETDGRLPSGQSLKEAIEAVDTATGNGPAYFMVNCAHPTHFDATLAGQEPWLERIRGLRANASKLSHAELDEATELDDGNPAEFGAQYSELRQRFPHINVLGGCCGTDHRHVEQACMACKTAT